MNCPNERFIFEVANLQDSAEILEILEEDDFDGRISLVYTRRPDGYSSFMKESGKVHLIVCRDTQYNKVVAIGVCAIREYFVNGKIEKVGYLLGLRLRKEYRGKFKILVTGYDFIHSITKQEGLYCYITTILNENVYAQKLLEKPRSFMPSYEPMGDYVVHIIKTRKKRKLGNTFRQVQESDIPRIIEFINNYGKQHQLYPVIREKDIVSGAYPGLRISDFYIMEDFSGEILAAGAVWDQISYKQYVVKKYGGVLNKIYPISCILPVFGYPSLPKPESVLKFFTLSFWAVKNNNVKVFERFINGISAVRDDYSFFVVGMHETHNLSGFLKRKSTITYSSKLYTVDWDKTHKTVNGLNRNSSIYLECGLL